MISSENTAKVTEKGKEGVVSNSKRRPASSNVREVKISKRCKSDMAEPFENVEKSSYLGVTIGAREDVVASVITKTRSGWSKFRDLVSLLASRLLR